MSSGKKELELKGNWNEIKGRLQKHWGQLTDEDLKGARGNVDLLVGIIQEKTGEARNRIERYLDDLSKDGAHLGEDAAHAAMDFAQDASESVRKSYDQVADGVRTGYHHAEGTVRRNPFESVAVAFGAGLISGVVVSLMLKR